MQKTEASATLTQFRGAVYDQALGHRKDTLFELMEAALVSSGPATLVRLSLAPAFRRGWPSAPDSLADGSIAVDGCRRVIHTHLPQVPVVGRPLWAIDGTVWPRPAAGTSPDRTWGHRTTPGKPQAGLVPGWEYQWLVAVPEPAGSWVLPLEVDRRGPHAGSPTALALAALRRALAARPVGAPRPVVTLDSGYDAIDLAQAAQATAPAERIAADLLIRLVPRRRFYRAPGPYKGVGTRPKHGPIFRLFDPATHGPPDGSATAQDPTHGEIRVEVWQQLHAQWAAQTPITVVRVQVEHLPHGRHPKPLWLAWIAPSLPDDLLDLWRWYARRFTVEHGFRFLKHDLGWTTIRPTAPEAADRWSWLLVLSCWQLWLARALVADQQLPWERPLPAERLTPGRVRRAFGALSAALGLPSRAPRPRGKAPGRRPGQCPGPRQRHPVVYRREKRAA
jgi:hypothetical protein